MGLLDFFRRKKKPSGPVLKDIWRGFQRVFALDNEIQVLMTYLDEREAASDGPGLDAWRVRIELLDRRFVDLVSALQDMSGDRWPELEVARARIRAAINERLAEPANLEQLRAILDLISPLTLVDRRSLGFRPENCCTFRDLARFAHEKAIQEVDGDAPDLAHGALRRSRQPLFQTPHQGPDLVIESQDLLKAAPDLLQRRRRRSRFLFPPEAVKPAHKRCFPVFGFRLRNSPVKI